MALMAGRMQLCAMARPAIRRPCGRAGFVTHTRTPPSLVVDNPYDGSVVAELPWTEAKAAKATLDASHSAFSEWRKTSLKDRLAALDSFEAAFKANSERVAEEMSRQMGKPLSQAQGEVKGMFQRLHAMKAMASEVLADDTFPVEKGITKFIKKEPVGVVLVIAPWNYPLMTAINAIAPAILCGNSVVIKHSERTPLTGDALAKAFADAGLPKNLVTSVHTPHDVTAQIIKDPRVGHVSFTGSVGGGRSVQQTAAAGRFVDTTLELGGKDPAYIAADADLDSAIAGVVDGAMYNAGQSCCAVERVYVHKSHYQKFVDGALELLRQYKLGDPFDPATSMGPLAQPNLPVFIQGQVKQAVSQGAKCLFGGNITNGPSGQGRFFEPTLLTDCTQSMGVMQDETFGPVLPVMAVESDQEALALMNDSMFGLTAGIWTRDAERAARMGADLQAGTVYMNRCDTLDPYLPWTGVKNTGKGVSLSKYGFRPYFRLKGFNFKA